MSKMCHRAFSAAEEGCDLTCTVIEKQTRNRVKAERIFFNSPLDSVSLDGLFAR